MDPINADNDDHNQSQEHLNNNNDEHGQSQQPGEGEAVEASLSTPAGIPSTKRALNEEAADGAEQEPIPDVSNVHSHSQPLPAPSSSSSSAQLFQPLSPPSSKRRRVSMPAPGRSILRTSMPGDNTLNFNFNGNNNSNEDDMTENLTLNSRAKRMKDRRVSFAATARIRMFERDPVEPVSETPGLLLSSTDDDLPPFSSSTSASLSSSIPSSVPRLTLEDLFGSGNIHLDDRDVDTPGNEDEANRERTLETASGRGGENVVMDPTRTGEFGGSDRTGETGQDGENTYGSTSSGESDRDRSFEVPLPGSSDTSSESRNSTIGSRAFSDINQPFSSFPFDELDSDDDDDHGSSDNDTTMDFGSRRSSSGGLSEQDGILGPAVEPGTLISTGFEVPPFGNDSQEPISVATATSNQILSDDDVVPEVIPTSFSNHRSSISGRPALASHDDSDDEDESEYVMAPSPPPLEVNQSSSLSLVDTVPVHANLIVDNIDSDNESAMDLTQASGVGIMDENRGEQDSSDGEPGMDLTQVDGQGIMSEDSEDNDDNSDGESAMDLTQSDGNGILDDQNTEDMTENQYLATGTASRALSEEPPSSPDAHLTIAFMANVGELPFIVNQSPPRNMNMMAMATQVFPSSPLRRNSFTSSMIPDFEIPGTADTVAESASADEVPSSSIPPRTRSSLASNNNTISNIPPNNLRGKNDTNNLAIPSTPPRRSLLTQRHSSGVTPAGTPSGNRTLGTPRRSQSNKLSFGPASSSATSALLATTTTTTTTAAAGASSSPTTSSRLFHIFPEAMQQQLRNVQNPPVSTALTPPGLNISPGTSNLTKKIARYSEGAVFAPPSSSSSSLLTRASQSAKAQQGNEPPSQEMDMELDEVSFSQQTSAPTVEGLTRIRQPDFLMTSNRGQRLSTASVASSVNENSTAMNLARMVTRASTSRASFNNTSSVDRASLHSGRFSMGESMSTEVDGSNDDTTVALKHSTTARLSGGQRLLPEGVDTGADNVDQGENGEEEDDDMSTGETPPMGLENFLKLVGISFLDNLVVSNRRRTIPIIPDLQASSASNASGNLVLQQQEKYNKAVFANAITVTNTQLEHTQTSCEELEKYIEAGRKVVQEIDEQDGQSLIRDYQSGPLGYKEAIKERLKLVKQNCNASALEGWYAWRKIMMSREQEEYKAHLSHAKADGVSIQEFQVKFATLQPSIMTRHSELKQKLEAARLKANAFAKTDKEELSRLADAIEEQGNELEKFKKDHSSKAKEITELERTVHGLETRLKEKQKLVEDCIQTIKENKFIKGGDVCRVWDQFSILQSVHRWTENTGLSSLPSSSVLSMPAGSIPSPAVREFIYDNTLQVNVTLAGKKALPGMDRSGSMEKNDDGQVLSVSIQEYQPPTERSTTTIAAATQANASVYFSKMSALTNTASLVPLSEYGGLLKDLEQVFVSTTSTLTGARFGPNNQDGFLSIPRVKFTVSTFWHKIRLIRSEIEAIRRWHTVDIIAGSKENEEALVSSNGSEKSIPSSSSAFSLGHRQGQVLLQRLLLDKVSNERRQAAAVSSSSSSSSSNLVSLPVVVLLDFRVRFSIKMDSISPLNNDANRIARGRGQQQHHHHTRQQQKQQQVKFYIWFTLTLQDIFNFPASGSFSWRIDVAYGDIDKDWINMVVKNHVKVGGYDVLRRICTEISCSAGV